MKKILTKIAAVTFVVGGLVAVMWPVPTWRMYDANWQELAMTQAESYCSGYVLGENGFNNVPDIPGMETCIAESNLDNLEPDIAQSVRLACTGLSIWFPEYVVSDCMADVEGFEVWFLVDGGYTWEWNASHPRPVVAHYNISQAPRGERGDNSGRDFTGRVGE